MPRGKDTVEIKRLTRQPDGPPKQQSFYAATREEAIEKWRRANSPPVGTHDYPPGTFGWVWAEKWVPLKLHLEQSTRDNYAAASIHLLEEIGDEAIGSIDVTRLTRAIAALGRKKTRRNHRAKDPAVKPIMRTLGASIVNKARYIGIDVMKLAYELGMTRIPINPDRVPRLEEIPKIVDVYRPGEMRRLLEASRGSVAYTFVLCGCFLGMTVNEGLARDADDLVDGGILRCRTQIDSIGEESSKMKTASRPRDFPLPPGLLAEFKALAKRGGWFAQTGDGKRRGDGNANRDLAAAARRAGLPPLTTHELRHCFSSWLDNNDCSTTTRRRLMGHSVKGVEHRYNQADLDKQREWLGRLWDEAEREWKEWQAAGGLMAKRGGGAKEPASGERNGRSRLSAVDVAQIKRRLKNEKPREIAPDYGVTHWTIERIRDGKLWVEVAAADDVAA